MWRLPGILSFNEQFLVEAAAAVSPADRSIEVCRKGFLRPCTLIRIVDAPCERVCSQSPENVRIEQSLA